MKLYVKLYKILMQTDEHAKEQEPKYQKPPDNKILGWLNFSVTW